MDKIVDETNLIPTIIPEPNTGFREILFAILPINENEEESKKHREVLIAAENLSKSLLKKMHLKQKLKSKNNDHYFKWLKT